MLTHVDVFIGVALVMLALSLLITILTQIFVFLINLRGRLLHKALKELFQELNIDATTAGKVATNILIHPLVRDGLFRKSLTPAIHKEDLSHLIKGANLLKTHLHVPEALASKESTIEAWFDATMNRVSNKFMLGTRIITIVAAITMTVMLHLNSFDLVSKLYKDAELRTRLADATAAMVTRGEEILARPDVLTAAVDSLMREKEYAGKLAPPGSKVETRAQVEAWLQSSAKDPGQAQVLLSRYDTLVAVTLVPSLNHWIKDVAGLQTELANTGLELIPHPYKVWFPDHFLEILGMLVSAALLSLGAPFWFNALKTASSLRPALAKKTDERGKDSGANDPGIE